MGRPTGEWFADQPPYQPARVTSCISGRGAVRMDMPMCANSARGGTSSIRTRPPPRVQIIGLPHSGAVSIGTCVVAAFRLPNLLIRREFGSATSSAPHPG